MLRVSTWQAPRGDARSLQVIDMAIPIAELKAQAGASQDSPASARRVESAREAYETAKRAWEAARGIVLTPAVQRHGGVTHTARGPRQAAGNAVVVQGYSLTVATYRTAREPRYCPQVVFSNGTERFKKTVGALEVVQADAIATAQADIDRMVAGNTHYGRGAAWE